MRLLTVISVAALVVLIAAVIGLGYVAFFYETHDKAHTQELNEYMVSHLMYEHVDELIEASDITMESDAEDWAALPGYGCFWTRAEADNLFPFMYVPSAELMTRNYIGTRDIWLMTSTTYSCDSNLETWTMDDNTGEVTYGRPDYDLYQSERPSERPSELPADAIGNPSPSSEDICASATKLLGAMTGKSDVEIRTEVFKTLLAHACAK